MHAVIVVESGLMGGRRQWLRQDQILTVGSSARADFAVREDSSLADLHFALRTCQQACWISTVGPGAATWLNHKPVRGEQPLADGDVITAGKSRFRVSLKASPNHGSTGGAAPFIRPGPHIQLRYSAEPCASGLARFVGTNDGDTLVDVARFLATVHTLHLVVNFRNARLPLRHALAADSDLLADLADQPLARNQLMLVSPGDEGDLFARLQSLLGKDAVCCVFSGKPKRELVTALRPAAISYSSPSILNAQLAVCPEGFVRAVLAPVSLVLVETPDGRPWSVYANPDVAPTWKEIGFPNPPGEGHLDSKVPSRVARG